MDERLIILGVALVFLVLSLVFLLATIARSRRSDRTAHASAEESAATGTWGIPVADGETETSTAGVFAEPSTGIAAVLEAPLRSGEWKPACPVLEPPKTSRVDDYRDALVPASEPPPAPAPAPEPPPEPAPEPPPEPAPEPPPEPAPEPPAAPPEHEMIAPVEMWFGDVRIGVRAGTKTHDRFQSIARELFDELHRSTTAGS